MLFRQPAASIMACARASLVLVSLGFAAAASGAVRHVPVKSHVELRPGEAITVTVDAAAPTEIGWETVQAKPCTGNCVQATDLGSSIHYNIATPMGASMKYTPVSGRIAIEYKNVSTSPVIINVYQVERTCEAEACKYIDDHQKARWLVFKVGEFTSIVTSRDESHSVISGVTTTGKPFTFRAVWWTDDRKSLFVNCAPYVKRYLENHTPKREYAPYIISGQATGEPGGIVLRSIDTCAAKAPNFGVPEKYVYKE